MRPPAQYAALPAANAASFLKLQLSNNRFLSMLKHLKENRQNGVTPEFDFSPIPEHDVSTVIRQLGEIVDTKLRELSPEFRLQSRGYRLPIPRVRIVDPQGTVAGKASPAPTEIRDALKVHRTLLLNIPRTYPDQSLAWIIADDLLTTEISGKQVLPIVINGSAIGPPRSGLNALSPYPLNKLAGMRGTELVFILDSVPLQSKTRTKYLVEQVMQFDSAKFIFVDRSELNLVSENEFITSVSAGIYNVCDISFAEMAHFVQKNFSMSGSEAEVIALRLRDTFTRFDLSAHPTYFAGIPRETLSALLQANRRAELIQLAVDGFLTFLVAEDEADVTLSRSTRARFLKQLALELRVQKKSLNHEQVITFTKAFSSEYDFEIDPLNFIQSFVSKGLLHFEDDRVHLSLPFIESYLVASALSTDQKVALTYFQIDDPNFDLATFDLYAEIGASGRLVDEIVQKLTLCVDTLQAGFDQKHVLLTDDFRPASLLKPERLRRLHERLTKAVDDVQNNRAGKEEKQRLIDFADRIKEAVAKHARESTTKQFDESTDKDLSIAVQVWVIGTVLLGSGAEHLNAPTKRRLAGLLIRLASLVLDRWTRILAAIDFEQVKTEVTKDDVIRSLSTKAEDVNETRRLVSSLVDILEQAILTEPIRRTIHSLCEQARHKVLAASIEAADVNGPVEQVIFGAWLADIDTKRGGHALKKAIRDLPMAPFLRIALVTHLLVRVYWSHWHKEDRLTLLDAADELINPLNVQIDKPRLKRLIEQGKPILGTGEGERNAD